MPRKPIDYSKGLIYRFIYNNETYYIGSTTNFTKRKGQHKSNCNIGTCDKYNYPVYKFIREHEGWDAWEMVLLEYYSCKDGNELRRRERHFIDEYKTILNKNIPTRTQKEHYIDNRDKIIADVKKYRVDNKAKCKEADRLKNIKNKDINKIRKAKKYQEKKEEIRLKSIQYREDNKDAINIRLDVNRDKRLARRRELYKIKMDLNKNI